MEWRIAVVRGSGEDRVVRSELSTSEAGEEGDHCLSLADEKRNRIRACEERNYRRTIQEDAAAAEGVAVAEKRNSTAVDCNLDQTFRVLRRTPCCPAPVQLRPHHTSAQPSGPHPIRSELARRATPSSPAAP